MFICFSNDAKLCPKKYIHFSDAAFGVSNVTRILIASCRAFSVDFNLLSKKRVLIESIYEGKCEESQITINNTPNNENQINFSKNYLFKPKNYMRYRIKPYDEVIDMFANNVNDSEFKKDFYNAENFILKNKNDNLIHRIVLNKFIGKLTSSTLTCVRKISLYNSTARISNIALQKLSIKGTSLIHVKNDLFFTWNSTIMMNNNTRAIFDTAPRNSFPIILLNNYNMSNDPKTVFSVKDIELREDFDENDDSDEEYRYSEYEATPVKNGNEYYYFDTEEDPFAQENEETELEISKRKENERITDFMYIIGTDAANKKVLNDAWVSEEFCNSEIRGTYASVLVFNGNETETLCFGNSCSKNNETDAEDIIGFPCNVKTINIAKDASDFIKISALSISKRISISSLKESEVTIFIEDKNNQLSFLYNCEVIKGKIRFAQKSLRFNEITINNGAEVDSSESNAAFYNILCYGKCGLLKFDGYFNTIERITIKSTRRWRNPYPNQLVLQDQSSYQSDSIFFKRTVKNTIFIDRTSFSLVYRDGIPHCGFFTSMCIKEESNALCFLSQNEPVPKNVTYDENVVGHISNIRYIFVSRDVIRLNAMIDTNCLTKGKIVFEGYGYGKLSVVTADGVDVKINEIDIIDCYNIKIEMPNVKYGILKDNSIIYKGFYD